MQHDSTDVPMLAITFLFDSVQFIRSRALLIVSGIPAEPADCHQTPVADALPDGPQRSVGVRDRAIIVDGLRSQGLRLLAAAHDLQSCDFGEGLTAALYGALGFFQLGGKRLSLSLASAGIEPAGIGDAQS